MKCPNCGAETQEPICEYCGTRVSAEVTPKVRCSKCGSTNVSFKRENLGEIRGKRSKQVVRRTVGFCKDCGNTWYLGENTPKKRKTWLWVLGWIFIFPIPLTILLLRKKEMKPLIKYGLIAAAWILYLVVVFANKPANNEQNDGTTTIHGPNQEETQIQMEEQKPKQEDTQTQTETETQSQETEPFSFVLMDGELGEYGVEVVLNQGTESEEHEITYYIPAGTYIVKNQNDKRAGQVTVYSGGPIKNGEWEEFVADEHCASPIVVMAGESKELEIMEGQFIVLSDGTSNIQFTLK